MTHAHLSKIERGQHTPRSALRAILCELLDLKNSDFDVPASATGVREMDWDLRRRVLDAGTAKVASGEPTP